MPEPLLTMLGIGLRLADGFRNAKIRNAMIDNGEDDHTIARVFNAIQYFQKSKRNRRRHARQMGLTSQDWLERHYAEKLLSVCQKPEVGRLIYGKRRWNKIKSAFDP